MPNAKLPAAQLDRIKADLEARRATLRVEVKAQLRGSGDDRVVGLSNRLKENDDWAVADALAELDIAGATHVRTSSPKSTRHWRGSAGGDYGLCTDCGDPIAAGRLVAYPTALRCIGCQSAHEKKSSGPPLTAV